MPEVGKALEKYKQCFKFSKILEDPLITPFRGRGFKSKSKKICISLKIKTLQK